MTSATANHVSIQAAELLFLHAMTSLHPGSGTSLGVVDLPIQRERHTQWPVIPASAIKGVLRDACREKSLEGHEADEGRTRRKVANEDDKMLTAAFGPGKVDESNGYAGALAFTDARILAFPVRSLNGVFAWITCPAVLERLNRDLKLAAKGAQTSKEAFAIPTVADKEAACASDSPVLIDKKQVVLEEFDFTWKSDAKGVADWIANHFSSDSHTCQRLRSNLVVLSDNDFTHFVRHATEVTARIALNYDTKTATGGALFYQECLPPETIFYTVVLACASWKESVRQNALEMVDYLRAKLPDYLQIGGDETTGKGICAVRLTGAKEGGK